MEVEGLLCEHCEFALDLGSLVTIIQSIWITGTTHNKFKFLFQKIILCQDKTECLLDDTPKQWKLLIAGLSEGEPISVPRKYFNCPETNSPCDFCDASLWAYVTVNYLRVRASASVKSGLWSHCPVTAADDTPSNLLAVFLLKAGYHYAWQSQTHVALETFIVILIHK